MGWGDDEAETVSVKLRFLGGLTERAVQVCLEDDFGDPQGTWVPLSQVERIEIEDEYEVNVEDLDQGEVAIFEIPEWLAEREGWS